jgi:hypothetical protein
MTRALLFLLALGTVSAGCADGLVTEDPSGPLAPATAESPGASLTSSAVGLTSDFRTWLSANGYAGYDFARSDVGGGSYGGRTSSGQAVRNHPVIFIHGNSDQALRTNAGQTGWTASIDYFQQQGYTSAELYATTWGPANPLASASQYHSRENVERIRAFIQAVKAYTGASKVDIVAHSMGVTLARKAIKGGSGYDALGGGSYDLGSSLTGSVDTFVGIAGANWGLVSCYYSGPSTPTCGSTNGLYPGYNSWRYGLSSFLSDLNGSSGYEGGYVYSIWSTADQVIGYNNYVWGRRTSQIPGQDGQRTFSGAPYGHLGSKDQTAYYQWRMVRYHSTS